MNYIPKTRHISLYLAIVSTIILTVWDLATPRGWGEWALYILPLLVLYRYSSSEKMFIPSAFILSALVFIGFFFSPGTIIRLDVAIFNRILAVTMIFLLAYLLNRYKKIHNELNYLNIILEEKVRARTKEVDNFFSIALDLLIIADTNGYFRRLSKQWEKTLGYTLEDMEGKNYLDFVHPDDIGSTMNAVNELKTQNNVNDFVNRYRCKDGSFRWIEWRSIPAGDLIYAAARDITDSKKADEKLKNSESFLNSIVENIPNMIFVKDAEELRFVRFNKAGEDLLGYSRTDLYGKNDNDLFPKEQAKWFIDKDRSVLNSKELLDVPEESINTAKHGERILHTKKIPILDEVGKPKFLLGISEDITERKQSEEDLKSRNVLLTTQMESSFEGILVVDEKGKIQSYNQRFVKMWGIPAEIIKIKSDEQALKYVIDKLIKPDEFIQKVKHLYEHIHDISTDEINLKDGRIFYRYSSPMIDKDEYYYGRVWYFRDITEQRHSEGELRIAKETAEVANRSKTEFLANMSHEIRTPMNAILGFAELLKNKVIDETGIDYLSGIETGGKNLLLLINDILDLSKIEANRIEIFYEPVNLYGILKELEQIFTFQAKKKEIDLSFEISPVIPKYLVLDHVRIRQILLNLIGNAIKFTHHGYVKLIVESIENIEDSSKVNLIIKVKDTGIGISPAQVKKIFEAFYQQEGQSTRKYGGSGLGLTISRRLIEMMNGTISIESFPGKGTIFSVNMNNISISLLHNEETSEELNTVPANLAFEEAKIMLVEDVESNRKIVKGFLENYNIQIIEAFDGKHAVDTLLKIKPDLILMDIQMPIMDGYYATELIKKNKEYEKIPVIALTAASSKANIEKIQNLFDYYLQKPVGRSKLINTLMKYLKYNISEPLDIDKNISYLEAFKTDIQKLPEIIVELEMNYLPFISELKEHKIINQIIEFAIKLEKYGRDSGAEVIVHFAKELLLAARSFNIDNIDKVLDDFIPFIKALKTNSNYQDNNI